MKLFESIGRLFFSNNFSESPEGNLKRLMEPICSQLASFKETGIHDGQMDVCIRKLRGILAAIYYNKLFQSFFDIISPYLNSLGRFISSDAALNGPFNGLRFFQMLGTNKLNRLSFETNGEYGYFSPDLELFCFVWWLMYVQCKWKNWSLSLIHIH
jgi:hypothetical protein